MAWTLLKLSKTYVMLWSYGAWEKLTLQRKITIFKSLAILKIVYLAIITKVG